MTCLEAARALLAAPVPERSPAPYAEARFVTGTSARGLRLVCVDSVSLVEPQDAGQIVLSGSHGGLVAGQPGLAIRVQAAAAFFNDAGIGIDEAGVTRLPALEKRGIAAATVDAASARIGDGRSTLDDGIVSRMNQRAASIGIVAGMRAREAVDLVEGGPL
jgi:hypothetical protein